MHGFCCCLVLWFVVWCARPTSVTNDRNGPAERFGAHAALSIIIFDNNGC